MDMYNKSESNYCKIVTNYDALINIIKICHMTNVMSAVKILHNYIFFFNYILILFITVIRLFNEIYK